MVARSQWGQYLAQTEVGDRIFVNGYRRALPAGPLCYAIRDIEKHAGSKNPSLLFGKAAAQRLGKIMRFDESSIVELGEVLNAIVLKANDIIKEALSPDVMSDSNGETLVWGRSRYDVDESHWTYLPCAETKVPWEEGQEQQSISAPEVDFATATEAQLDVIGIDYTVHKDEDQAGID